MAELKEKLINYEDLAEFLSKSDERYNNRYVDKWSANSFVTSATLGGVELPKDDQTIQLPAYPTELPASDTVHTYSALDEHPISGKGVETALATLNYNDSEIDDQYVSSVKQTNGVIAVIRKPLPAGDGSVTGSEIKFVKSVSLAGHTLSGTLQEADSVIEEDSSSIPTSAAVKNYVDKTIEDLEIDPLTEEQKQKIENAVQEAPCDGISYARENGKWKEIVGAITDYIKKAAISIDGNTLVLTKEDDVELEFNPSTGKVRMYETSVDNYLSNLIDGVTIEVKENLLVVSKLDGQTCTVEEINIAAELAHDHDNKTLLDALISSGDGDKYLADDGTYKTIEGIEEAPVNSKTYGRKNKTWAEVYEKKENVNIYTSEVLVGNSEKSINITPSGAVIKDNNNNITTIHSDSTVISSIDNSVTVSDLGIVARGYSEDDTDKRYHITSKLTNTGILIEHDNKKYLDAEFNIVRDDDGVEHITFGLKVEGDIYDHHGNHLANKAEKTDVEELKKNAGKIKVHSDSDYHYLQALVDAHTIQIVDDKLVAKKLDGQIISITELNYLKGAKSDIQEQLDVLKGVKSIYDVFDTKADLDADEGEPGDGQLALIRKDEDYHDKQTSYVFVKGKWEILAEVNEALRDFREDPLSLETEITGVLDKDNIDDDIARVEDVLTKEEYEGSEAGVVKSADTLKDLESSVEDIDDAVEKRHEHENKELLDAITSEGDGNKYLSNDGTYKVVHSGNIKIYGFLNPADGKFYYERTFISLIQPNTVDTYVDITHDTIWKPYVWDMNTDTFIGIGSGQGVGSATLLSLSKMQYNALTDEQKADGSYAYLVEDPDDGPEALVAEMLSEAIDKTRYIMIASANNITVEGFSVPELTNEQIKQAFEAFKNNKEVYIVNSSGNIKCRVNCIKLPGYVSILFEDKLIVNYEVNIFGDPLITGTKLIGKQDAFTLIALPAGSSGTLTSEQLKIVKEKPQFVMIMKDTMTLWCAYVQEGTISYSQINANSDGVTIRSRTVSITPSNGNWVYKNPDVQPK